MDTQVKKERKIIYSFTATPSVIDEAKANIEKDVDTKNFSEKIEELLKKYNQNFNAKKLSKNGK